MENLLGMRKVVLAALVALMLGALMSPASAVVPVEWLASGGTLFAGGGTNLTNGTFFPGTAIYDGKEFQGLPPLQIKKGTDLDFVNLDVAAVTNSHQIMSFKRKHGSPVFASEPLAGPGRAVIITSNLKPGVYPFFCATHFGMYGRLEITP